LLLELDTQAVSNQECHADESRGIVRAACQGLTTCDIAASNAIFGDPCGGTFKYLTAYYRCNDPANADADMSILDELENWRDPTTGDFTLKMVWPERDGRCIAMFNYWH
jgi:hypothetical protein